MHELSLCVDMIEQVSALAVRHRAPMVTSITVRIGVLSGVEPLLFDSAFAIAKLGTVAENARLAIETVPVRVICRACSAESEVAPQALRCSACGNVGTDLLAGDEITLASVELAVPESEPAAT